MYITINFYLKKHSVSLVRASLVKKKLDTNYDKSILSLFFKNHSADSQMKSFEQFLNF